MRQYSSPKLASVNRGSLTDLLRRARMEKRLSDHNRDSSDKTQSYAHLGKLVG